MDDSRTALGGRAGAAKTVGSPLPQAYLTALLEGVGGRIKVRPEDFLVDELPLYEPCGEGEHVYLGIEKCRVSHGEMLSHLSRHFRVPRDSIGFAGMKDKQGVTRQLVSIQIRDDPSDLDLQHDRIHILWARRHRNKLRRGHLAGNRFAIRIREVDPLRVPTVLKVLRELEREGVPCYFGSQRFGYRLNNQVIGAALLREDWTGLLDELLGAKGSSFPEFQRERRELYGQGRLEPAAKMWTPSDRAELIAIRALVSGKSPRQACLSVGRTALTFWLSAWQSAVFNRVLDRRLEEGTVDRFLEGDVAFKHQNRAVFAVTADVLADPDTPRRLTEMEISPSGPLWGLDMVRASGPVDAAEEAALESTGLTLAQLLGAPRVPTGGRRPMRAPIRNVSVSSGTDEHGYYIKVLFDLPRGIYATVALREVMKNDARDEDDESEAESLEL